MKGTCVSHDAVCLRSVTTTPPLPQIHLLIKLGLQRVLREDVELDLPVAKEHSGLEHDQGLLQPLATGHHGQVDPELRGQHSLKTPEFSRPPRKKKNKLDLLINS